MTAIEQIISTYIPVTSCSRQLLQHKGLLQTFYGNVCKINSAPLLLQQQISVHLIPNNAESKPVKIAIKLHYVGVRGPAVMSLHIIHNVSMNVINVKVIYKLQYILTLYQY